MRRTSTILFLFVFLVLAPLVFSPAAAFPADFYTLFGTVTFNGVVANGCQVCAWEASGVQQGNCGYTDSNGYYQMTLFPGSYNINVDGTFNDYWGGTYSRIKLFAGYPAAENFVMSGDATLNIPMTTNTLTGRVKDVNGQGIANVRLSMENWDEWPGLWTSETFSAADGSYKLLVYPGTHDISVEPPPGSNFVPTAIQVEISDNTFRDVILEEEQILRLSGLVTVNGAPANGCRVSASKVGGGGNSANVDSSGYYQVTLFPGTYNIYVDGTFNDYWGGTYSRIKLFAGYPAAENFIMSGDANLKIPMTINTLTGRVTDVNGQGIANVKLSMENWDEWPGLWTSETFSAADGSYKLLVYPGTHDISVVTPSGSGFVSTMIQAYIPGDSVRDIVLEEEQVLTLSGTVTFNEAVANGCQVCAWEAKGAHQGNCGYTDSNGHYRMTLFPGTYNINVDGTFHDYWGGTYSRITLYSGYPAADNFVMSGDANIDIPVTTNTLTGRVTDVNGQGIANVALSLEGREWPALWTSGGVSAADGSYKLLVYPGTYSVGVAAPPEQFPPFTIQRITFTGDTTRDIVLSYDYAVLEGALASIPDGLNLHQDIFGIIDQSATKIYDVPLTSSRDVLTLIPNWGGSELAVSVYRPDGSFYGTFQSTHPPIIVNIPDPGVGTWRCEVTAVDVPYDNYPIALVAAIAPIRFSDAMSGFWAYDFITALSNSGITAGCSDDPPRFCPDDPITRGQMAVFLETSLGNPPAECTGRFADVPPSDPFCGFIERMAEDGITGGCGGGNFCPDAPVARAQMAVFIEAALGHSPDACSNRFTDVPAGDPICGFIERLTADGITSGCTAENFCPNDPVTRAQMAVFLVAAPAPFNP